MISIAMTVYNGEKYISEQLESIAGQTLLPDELVICNDSSTDRSLSVLDELKKRAPFKVNIINHETNKGYAIAFNTALCKTSGDFVFLCDQDDCWFPNKIESVITAFKENPQFLFVSHNAMCTDSNLKSLDKTLFDYDVIRNLEYGSAIHGCVTCIRRELLDYALPIPQSYTFDRWFALLAQSLNLKFRIDSPLQYYRRHEKAISFETIGKNQTFLDKITGKIKKNYKSIYKARTIENFDFQRNKITSLVNFIGKIRSSETLPSWCNEELLAKMTEETNHKNNAFIARADALKNKGFMRLTAVLKNYKKGYYKPFKGIQTALDDLFRSTK
ncbi:MAG: glycosyltransferase [Candidatus Riflebacteria bacterium]|nr:glycosyltransferase [Candidatus Riflebacteria bacterium]